MKKGIKLFAVILVVIFAIAVISSCAPKVVPSANAQESAASAESSKQLKKIGLSMYTQKNPYYKAMQNAITAYCKEKGIELVSTDAQDDINKQVSNIEDLLAQKVDAILMNPKDPDAIVEVVKKAASQGVPVVSLDNMVSAAAPVLTVVLSNNTQNGKLVGAWLAKKMGDTPIKAFIISGEMGSVVGEDRRQGLIRGVVEEQLKTKNVAKIEIVGQIYTDWLADVAQTKFEDASASLADFNVILSEADVMTIACMKVLDDMGKTNIIFANAADGEKLAFELIMEGKPYATGLNSPGLIGKTGVDILQGHLEKGETYGAITYTPAACVNSDNVKDFYDPNAAF